ncbi:MAG: hypothetical protein Q9207_002307 [Kuettlingeria erythrocarpa]
MPSPTLTNPDLILPQSQFDFTTKSPPTRSDDPSSLPQWSHSEFGDDGQMKSAVRNLFGNNGYRLRHRNSEKALKTQETFDLRSQSKQLELGQRNADSALASSPLLREEFGMKDPGKTLPRHTANDNADSTDDGSVISESVSPLVDAEREEFLMSEHGGIDGYKFSNRFRNALTDEDDDSHATMSVKAEEILANAKKRLTEMESNLNRARHTINRPSSSMSSFLTSNSDPPSMYTLPQNPSPSPSKHRHHNSPPANPKGHSRVFSETSIPSSMQTLPPNGENSVEAMHSTSVMDALNREEPASTGVKQGSESRDWFWTGLTRNTSHGPKHNNYGLQPLNEDGPPPSTFSSPERQESPPIAEIDNGPNVPDREGTATTGLERSKSTNQMRDIRDQMQDLKGKISSLKQRAREDSLRRRSLQSLRTPSPFTAAEQWYTGTSTLKDQSRSRPREGSPPNIQPAIEEEDESKQYPVQEPENLVEEDYGLIVNGSNHASEDFHGRLAFANGSVARENGDSPWTVIDAGVTDEKLEVSDQTRLEEPIVSDQQHGEEVDIEAEGERYPESPALPIGGRHEDRPDAFDYEHLFLHSKMGTLGREGKSRSSSHSSMYSVETTKPSNVTTEASEVGSDDNVSLDETEEEAEMEAETDAGLSDPHRNSHERKGSMESVSTVATFATATEGASSNEEGQEDEWVFRRPMAGSWEPEYPNQPQVTLGQDKTTHAGRQETRHSPPRRSPSVHRNRNGSADSAASPIQRQTDAKISEAATPELLAFLSSKLPSKEGALPRLIELNDSDRELAERLVRSVAQVCSQLQAFSMEGNKYGGRPWRRRLDSARRLLDGETNGEVF